jgi:hypothetical protein
VDAPLELVVRAALLFPLGDSQVLWWIRFLRYFSKMIFDMLDALISALQNVITETAYMVEKVHNSELPSCLQSRNFQIVAAMFASQVCREVIRPRNGVGWTDFPACLVDLLAYPHLIGKVDALNMLGPPFRCK